MIYITGDTHADFRRFSTDNFPEQKEMTKDDFVIVCGDFGGVWCDNREERYWLNWLNDKPFTTLFVDGNHENFDRLYSGEFETTRFSGGYAHKIHDSIYHLMRGEVFELQNKKFFTFGGASSHDIQDGILNESDYPSIRELVHDYNKRTRNGEMLRINHVSWWEQELPSDEEIKNGIENLKKNDYKVDYIITHCAPQHVVSTHSHGFYKPDKLTEYFNLIDEATDFDAWIFGHYHDEKKIFDKYCMLYEQIVRLV